MGYLHDVPLSRFLHPEETQVTAGAWSDRTASGVWSLQRAAAAGAFYLKIPLLAPGNAQPRRCCRLVSIDLWWRTLSADLALLSALIDQEALAANGAAETVENLAFSYDAAHAVAAGRCSQAAHKMTLALITPVWLGANTKLSAHLSVTPGAASVFDYYGARLNYLLRI